MNQQTLLSEEDIRTKVVTTWLADHGFGPTDISIELSFEIRLGRGIFKVDSNKIKQRKSPVFRPRADVLVRNHEGKNLLIVEVKAPDQALDNDVREQGISYARLLREGGIAPFVLLTNGHETQIYDSISGERVEGTQIPLNHPYVKAGFRVTVDDLAARAKALEALICLSPDNLLEFCRHQVDYRMRLLRSDDPYSGKKYIPALYIEREEAGKRLTKLLDEERRRVVVVIGPPQVGKTNFICHAVEERIKQAKPCLFYPAIGMSQGLFKEIGEDFEWMIGDNSSPYRLVHHKLTRILRKSGQRLVIFIDGWNEANLNLARAIDRESERLSCDDIAFVISMTNVAASRLLSDAVGNPSHIAEAASISSRGIPLLEISPEKQNEKWSTVSVPRYSLTEAKEAYQKYSAAFKVEVASNHRQIHDPFLLRIGMQQFQGQTLPDSLEEPELIAQFIRGKASRAVDLNEDVVPTLLSELAAEMFAKEAPVNWRVATNCFGLPLTQSPPKGLFEAAILAKVSNQMGLPSIKFYNERERDFVVAYWTRNWPNRFQEDPQAMAGELALAVQTEVGANALRWFLRNHVDFLKLAAESFSSYKSSSVKRLILSSTREYIGRRNQDEDWATKVADKGVYDADFLVKAEAVKLIVLLTEDSDRLASVISEDIQFVEELLSIEEEYPLGKDSVGHVVLQAFYNFHLNTCNPYDDSDSPIFGTLTQLLNHHSSIIRQAASKALSYITPDLYLDILVQILQLNLNFTLDREVKNFYAGSIELAVAQLHERYYFGSIVGCPTFLESLFDDYKDGHKEPLYNEYEKMREICLPVIALFWPESCAQELSSLLEALEPPDIDEFKARRADALARRYQLSLPLPLDDFDMIGSKN